MIVRLLVFVAVCIVGSTAPAAAQRLMTITGTVADSASGEPLRSVAVRTPNGKKGSLTRMDGSFVFRLERADTVRLVVTLIGYKPKVLELFGADSVHVDVRLAESAIVTGSVVVTAEDPGVALMRKVIQRRRSQEEELRTASYTLYTKLVTSTDTSTAGRTQGMGDTTIFAIFESYSRSYYRSPDEHHQRIFQRRQTENIPPTANEVAVGASLSMYSEVVSLLGEDIITPFSDRALSLYDFRKEREWVKPTGTVARIRIIPNSSQAKLVDGYVDVDVERCVPLAISVVPSEAVRLPLGATARWEQYFSVSEEGFALPMSLSLRASLDLELLWLINPRVDIAVDNYISDVELNTPLDPELFEGRRVEVEARAAVFDTAYWYNNEVVKLTEAEARAYEQIRMLKENPDSVDTRSFSDQILDPLFSATRALNTRPFTGIEDVFRHNRIHGAYLGVGQIYDIDSAYTVMGRAGYGFGDKEWYIEGRLERWLDSRRKYSLAVDGYRRLARRDDPEVVRSGGITLLSILFGNDYGDYYYNQGAELSFNASYGQERFLRRDTYIRPTRLKLFVRKEFHRSAVASNFFSLFGPDSSRANPAARPGEMLSAGFEYAWDLHPTRRFAPTGFLLRAEHGFDGILGGQMEFGRYEAMFYRRQNTLGSWRATLLVNAGYSVGTPPPQKWYSFETSLTRGLAQQGAPRTMLAKEFSGERWFSAGVEHNFGELIPGLLRIPNIASLGIEVILTASAAWSEFRPETLAAAGYSLQSTAVTADRWFYEVGLGLNNVLLFFRTDFTVRLSQTETPRLAFTLSASTR